MSRGAQALLLSASILVAACDRKALTFADDDHGAEEVEVVTPAVLLIGDQQVRLAGVSTPQPAPEAKCWAEALLAREAMQMLRAHTDRVSDLQVMPAADKPGTARVLVDGRDLSRLLVSEGFAASSGAGWDWCGPMQLKTPRAPHLGYRVEAVQSEGPQPQASAKAAE